MQGTLSRPISLGESRHCLGMGDLSPGGHTGQLSKAGSACAPSGPREKQ